MRYFQKASLTPVCLYTDSEQRRRESWRYPALRQKGLIHLDLVTTEGGLDTAADFLRDRFRIHAVVPTTEPTVWTAGKLGQLLNCEWSPLDVLAAFRDKPKLKARIGAVAPDLRLNACRRVTTLDDVLDAVHSDGFPAGRLVLKPADGYGGIGVAYIDRSTSVNVLAAHMDRFSPRDFALEEFVEGDEYAVNGQVDAAGNVDVLAVFHEHRERPWGAGNLAETETRLVHTHDHRFRELADYAMRVLAATGLRRSPFHLEAILSERGPVLVEVGARLAGRGGAFAMADVHGGSLDVFSLAAHHYLTADRDLGIVSRWNTPDWSFYDSHAYREVSSLGVRHERIYEVSGVHEVEAHPAFVRWITRPEVGDRLVASTDILSLPWHVAFRAPDEETVADGGATARRLIRWNDRSHGVRRVWRRLRALGPPVRRRWASWTRSPRTLPIPAATTRGLRNRP